MEAILKIAMAAFVGALLLAGCVSTRVSGEKVVVLNERITSLGVCVQHRFFTKVKDTRGEATAISVGNRQLSELYPKLVERLPLIFARADVQSAAAMCETEGTRVPPELNGYSQILRISPGKSEFVGSSYSLWLNAEIFQRYGGRVIWRGEVGWSSTGTAKVNDELADDVVQKLLIQMQEDEVIPKLKNVVMSKASSKPVVLNHSSNVPAATIFAAVEDVNAVPNLGQRGKELYLEWLTKPFPRAMALSDRGGFARGYGANAMQQALQNCEKVSGNPCRLYAVDDQVVWTVSDTPPTNGIAARAGATHAVPVPSSTGFAPLNDVNAVPKLGPKGKDLYLEWLTKPFPRAVAVSDKGAMARGYGANAMQQAVQNCEKLFGNPCRLYAVDDQVVWKIE